MNIQDGFYSLFKSDASKLLVLLAFVGISLSVYPVYEGLYNDTGKKIELIKKWKELGYKELDPKTIDAVYEQLSTELENNNGRLESTISVLSKSGSEQSFSTFFIKFLAGGFFYFFTYGMSLLFLCSKKTNRKEIFELLMRHLYVICIWLGMSIINMLIPFYSISVNYVFLPSCLTLIAAALSILWNGVTKVDDEYASSPTSL